MYYSPIIEVDGTEYDLYEDFHVIPKDGKIVLPTPTPKIQTVEYNGSNWHGDLTTALTGEVVYEAIAGTINFLVLNDYVGFDNDLIRSKFMNLFHGKTVKFYLEGEESWYHKGFIYVSGHADGKDWDTLTITYDFYPYALKRWYTDEDWIWDPFNFDTDMERDWGGIVVDGYKSITFDWSRKSVTPHFIPTVTGSTPDNPGTMTVSLDGADPITFTQGSTEVSPKIRFKQGSHTLVIRGNGTMNIHAQEGTF